jgi:transposase
MEEEGMDEVLHVRRFAREAGWTLPASLDGLVPSDHPVRFVAAYIDGLTAEDWQTMGVAWQEGGPGAHGYHPRLLLGVWLWGFMSGCRSTRHLERACREQVSFLWLTGMQQPDHATLHRFYQAHRAGMRYLLTDTVQMAVRVGLVDLAVQAVDGTKVSGNAALDRSYTGAGLDRLLERTEAAIAELEAQRESDDGAPPPRLPETLRDAQALRTRLAAARGRLTAPEGRTNLTDPDAQVMKSRHGFLAGFNAQAVTSPLDAAMAGRAGMLITAAEVTTATDDYGQLVPMLAAAEAATGSRAAVTLADGGYCSAPVLEQCALQQVEVVMPVTDHRRTPSGPYHRDHFTYDAASDQYVCPEGQVLPFAGMRQRRGAPPARAYHGPAAVCRACPAFGVCTRDGRKGRVVEVRAVPAVVLAQQAMMATDRAVQLYSRRKTLIEPVFGMLKERHRLTRFLVRGRTQVQAEWQVLAAAFNLCVLASLRSHHAALLAH